MPPMGAQERAPSAGHSDAHFLNVEVEEDPQAVPKECPGIVRALAGILERVGCRLDRLEAVESKWMKGTCSLRRDYVEDTARDRDRIWPQLERLDTAVEPSVAHREDVLAKDAVQYFLELLASPLECRGLGREDNELPVHISE